MPKIAGQKKQMPSIAAHKEEMLLDAPADEVSVDDMTEKDLPAYQDKDTIMPEAEISDTDSTPSDTADYGMADDEITDLEVDIEERSTARPISTHSKWTNTILAILCVCGAFLAGYLLYFNFHGHTDQPDIMAKHVTVDSRPAIRAGN